MEQLRADVRRVLRPPILLICWFCGYVAVTAVVIVDDGTDELLPPVAYGSFLVSFVIGTVLGWREPIQPGLAGYLRKLASTGTIATGVALIAVPCLLFIGPVEDWSEASGQAAWSVLGTVLATWLGVAVSLVSFAAGVVSSGLIWVGACLEIVMAAGPDSTGDRSVNTFGPWLPKFNAYAVMDHGHTYTISVPEVGAGRHTGSAELSFLHGLGYWGVVVAVVLVAAGLVVRRRLVSGSGRGARGVRSES